MMSLRGHKILVAWFYKNISYVCSPNGILWDGFTWNDHFMRNYPKIYRIIDFFALDKQVYYFGIVLLFNDNFFSPTTCLMMVGSVFLNIGCQFCWQRAADEQVFLREKQGNLSKRGNLESKLISCSKNLVSTFRCMDLHFLKHGRSLWAINSRVILI